MQQNHNLYEILIFKNLTFYGLIVWDYFSRFPDGVAQLLAWIKQVMGGGGGEGGREGGRKRERERERD